MAETAQNSGAEPASAKPASGIGGSDRLAGRTVILNDLFEIFFDHPVPRLDHVGARVYQARSLRGGGGLAYVCERTASPRLQAAEKIIAIQNASLIRLIGRGVIRCPDGVERYVLVYDHTLGNPVVPHKGEAPVYGMRVDVIIAAVLRPLVSLLHDMHNADMVHGALRADNLFDGGASPIQRVILGDCLSDSFSATQPLLYLSPFMAMASPAGRGLGRQADDMYALGATMAVLLRTHDPMQGRSEMDILLSKIETGSFSTLLSNERLPSNVMELLRGLLQDDVYLRWTITDVMDWFEARRGTHRQGIKRLRASRHIQLGDHKILSPSVFAVYASQQPGEVVKLVDNGEIKQWLVRSISDNRLDDRFEMAVETSKEYGRGTNFPDRVASRIAAAFEPEFPILYRGVGVYPDSFGTVLADALIRGQDVKIIADLINDQAVMFWMNMQHEVPADVNLVINRFEQCQQFLKQRTIGYGLERCLYLLAPDTPCLSPKLEGFYVNSPEALLRALNEIAKGSHLPETIFDRHIIAFLSVRDRKMIDTYLPDLNSEDRYRQVSGTIQALAAIQMRGKMPPMPALARWMVTIAEPAYERFHDRDLRAALRKKADSMKDQGIIQKIVEGLFELDRQRLDQYEYRMAMHEYHQLSLESQNLETALANKDQFGIQTGREVAALIAGIIMALALAGLTLLRVNQGGIPW